MHPIWIITAILALSVLFFVGWRWASNRWQLPCPSLFGWALESRFYGWLSGTGKTLDRMDLQPGQRILEIGPGPGRAERVQPDGEALGIDIQPGMIERLRERAERTKVPNLTAILGDATEPHVDEGTFDLVFIVTTLGEIPNRSAALAESYKALKPGGVLSITELFGDPHYQSRSTVRRLAEEAGFELQTIHGHWWFFTANFVKP